MKTIHIALAAGSDAAEYKMACSRFDRGSENFIGASTAGSLGDYFSIAIYFNNPAVFESLVAGDIAIGTGAISGYQVISIAGCTDEIRFFLTSTTQCRVPLQLPAASSLQINQSRSP